MGYGQPLDHLRRGQLDVAGELQPGQDLDREPGDVELEPAQTVGAEREGMVVVVPAFTPGHKREDPVIDRAVAGAEALIVASKHRGAPSTR